MPLDKSCDEKAVSRNIRQLYKKDGKPHLQSIAIALSVLQRACGIKGDAKMSPKEMVARSKKKQESAVGRFVPIEALIERARKTSGFGFDMAVRMGIHGVGVSPQASGDPKGRGRYQFHVPPGEAKVVAGDPMDPKRQGRRR
jgi:hypothetical protein